MVKNYRGFWQLDKPVTMKTYIVAVRAEGPGGRLARREDGYVGTRADLEAVLSKHHKDVLAAIHDNRHPPRFPYKKPKASSTDVSFAFEYFSAHSKNALDQVDLLNKTAARDSQMFCLMFLMGGKRSKVAGSEKSVVCDTAEEEDGEKEKEKEQENETEKAAKPKAAAAAAAAADVASVVVTAKPRLCAKRKRGNADDDDD